MSTSPVILVIEDDPQISEIIEFNLLREQFTVVKAMDGEAGLRTAAQPGISLVVLDLMLPKRDGIDVCRVLRSKPESRNLAIIMLTAKGEESDIIRGLEAGADDYLTKPFSPKELVARVRAVLRRTQGKGAAEKSEILKFKELSIDSGRHEAKIGPEILKLTRTEFRLLHALVLNPGRVFTRDQLIEKVGGPDLAIIDRNIDVHVSSLRKKLLQYGPELLTVRGVGYRFRDE